jgi:hypothetical protein
MHLLKRLRSSVLTTFSAHFTHFHLREPDLAKSGRPWRVLAVGCRAVGLRLRRLDRLRESQNADLSRFLQPDGRL